MILPRLPALTAALTAAALVAFALLSGSTLAAAERGAPSVSTRVVQEAREYWTETLADPLDYANPEDQLLARPAHQNVEPRVSDGQLRWTKTETMDLALVFAGYGPSAFATGREGLANPVDASRYTHASLMLYSETRNAAQILWDSCGPDAGRCTDRAQFIVEPGWNHYVVPLEEQGWSGQPVEVRLAVAGDGTPIDMALDWARLYEPGEQVRVDYEGETLYWDADAQRSNNTTGQPGWGVLDDDGGGRATFPADAFPPGEYRFYADEGPYSEPVVVDAPVPVFDAPHERGGADYAATVTGDPWDFEQPGDVAELGNVTDAVFRDGTLRARNDPGADDGTGPYLYLRTGDPIDADRFHRLTVKTTLAGPFDLSHDPGGGSHGRFLWRYVGQGDTPFLYDSKEIVVYPGVNSYTIDLHTDPPEAIVETDKPHRRGWVGDVATFRYDPNEDPGQRAWTISEISLRADHETSGGKFTIRWHDPTTAVSDTSVSLYYDDDDHGFDGELIAADVAQTGGDNAYRWDASSVPPGTYWVYAVAERDNHTVGRRYASGRLRVTGRFADVEQGHPHWPGIAWAAAEEITVGYPDDTYRPATAVTRGQMAAFLARALDLPDAGDADFRDVPSGHPHVAAIGSLADSGIASGYADGSFRPAAPVTRAHIASFLARGLSLPDTDDGEVFADVPASSVHADAIGRLAAADVVAGFPDGTYRPTDAVTRAQMATFLHRALTTR